MASLVLITSPIKCHLVYKNIGLAPFRNKHRVGADVVWLTNMGIQLHSVNADRNTEDVKWAPVDMHYMHEDDLTISYLTIGIIILIAFSNLWKNYLFLSTCIVILIVIITYFMVYELNRCYTYSLLAIIIPYIIILCYIHISLVLYFCITCAVINRKMPIFVSVKP